MCGLAGRLMAGADPHDGALEAMAAAIAHRGPDAQGVWQGDGVGLAHRRLSIIDLAGGDQPIANEDGAVRVVFNGELYNYRELRAGLVERGHRFRTQSDTEVLVHLYEERGADLVTVLRGMFAFAVWDDRRRRLLLARDRIGLKPLYYYRDAGKTLFGSETKAILAHPGVDRTLDDAAVEAYLAWGVIPGEASPFRRIRKLPPAHVLEIEADRPGDARPRRYWRLETAVDETLSLDAWSERLREKLAETVRAHRIADVPVGAFLSGGVDSGALVAEMSRQGEAPRTFSIGFEDAELCELDLARQVAQRYGTAHTEEVVTADAAGGLDRLTDHYDEPFADASAIPTMRVAELAREHVKVVVSGDGGDEAFGGYTRYAHDLREDAVRRRAPRWLRRRLLAPAAAAWPEGRGLPRPLRAKTALTNLALDPGEAYANTLALFRPAERARLLGADRALTPNLERSITRPYAEGRDPLQSMTTADIGMLLPDRFLTKVDRASMAVGLEVRPPLVDHEFLELAVRVPSRWKVRHGETKWVFKRMQQDRLPEAVVRGRKRGFDCPVGAWMRGPLRERLEAMIAPSGPLADRIETAEARRLNDQHQAGRGGLDGRLWALLVLGAWLERYAAAPRPSGLLSPPVFVA